MSFLLSKGPLKLIRYLLTFFCIYSFIGKFCVVAAININLARFGIATSWAMFFLKIKRIKNLKIMDVLVLKSVLFIIVQFVPLSNAIEYDEGCFLDEPAALQVAFVMDQTGTFLIGTQDRPSFFNEFAALAPKLMTEIDKDYPGSQFALSTHYDWPFTARPPYANNSFLHNDT